MRVQLVPSDADLEACEGYAKVLVTAWWPQIAPARAAAPDRLRTARADGGC